jgi:hypothetical protein
LRLDQKTVVKTEKRQFLRIRTFSVQICLLEN